MAFVLMSALSIAPNMNARAENPAAEHALSSPGTYSPTSPLWIELSASQQVTLHPLATHWDTLSTTQKRKWLGISANFEKLKPSEQHKLHNRMVDWVTLMPKQRAQARRSFTESQKIPDAQKQAHWRTYQALSPQDKQRLIRSGAANHAGAPAASPNAMALSPAGKLGALQPFDMAKAMRGLNRNTLLPHPTQSASGAATKTP